MILTEKEASTRRCQEGFAPPHSDIHQAPMAVATSYPAISTSTYGYGMGGCYAAVAQSYSPFHCIGSKCMAWRWHLSADVTECAEAVGYCGKVGKP